MKFVSVPTSDARGGAEFGAASMLEALIAEGHEVMLLSDQPEIAAELGVPSESIELGAKPLDPLLLATGCDLAAGAAAAASRSDGTDALRRPDRSLQEGAAARIDAPRCIAPGPARGRAGTGSVPDAKGARPAGLPGRHPAEPRR